MNSDLFEYPFLSGVWGTAADWTMVVVTALTLIYLILTLKSQRDIQRLQLKVTRIENERFIADQKLNFHVQATPTTNYVAEPLQIFVEFKIKLLNGNCTNLKIFKEDKRCKVFWDEENKYEFPKMYIDEIKILKAQIGVDRDTFVDQGCYVGLTLLFDDRVENTFAQRIHVNANLDAFDVQNTDPTLMGS